MNKLFIDQNPIMQEMARELRYMRDFNRFLHNQGQAELLFAEATLLISTLEHFVRIVVSAKSKHERSGIKSIIEICNCT